MCTSNTAFTERILCAAMIVLMVCCVPNFPRAACVSDINLDGRVDTLDAALVSREIGRADCFTNPCKADLNTDGEVNSKDEKILQAELGRRDCRTNDTDVPEHNNNVSRSIAGEAGLQQEPQKELQAEMQEAVPERVEHPADSGDEDFESTEVSISQRARFKDNEDGTITDPDTGLMWTQNANLPGDTMLFYDALRYIERMNRGDVPNFGYTDWRLPTLEELQSIVDYTSYTMRGHGLTPGHPFKNVRLQKYGSFPIGSVYCWVPDTSWLFSLYCRVVGRNVNACLGYVWPVRDCT